MKFDEDDKIRAMLNAIPETDFYQTTDIKIKKKKETILLLLSKEDIKQHQQAIFNEQVNVLATGDNALVELTLPSEQELRKELLFEFKDHKSTNTQDRKERVRRHIFYLFFREDVPDYHYWKRKLDEAVTITIKSEMKKGKRRLFHLAVKEIQKENPALLEHKYITYHKELDNRKIFAKFNIQYDHSLEKIEKYSMNTQINNEDDEEIAQPYRERLDQLINHYQEQMQEIDHGKLRQAEVIDEILPKQMKKKIKAAIDRLERKEQRVRKEANEISAHNKKIIKAYEKERKQLEREYIQAKTFSATMEKGEDLFVKDASSYIEMVKKGIHATIQKNKSLDKITITLNGIITQKSTDQQVETYIHTYKKGRQTMQTWAKEFTYYEGTPNSFDTYNKQAKLIVHQPDMNTRTYEIYVLFDRWRWMTPRDFETMKDYVGDRIHKVTIITAE